MRLFASMRTRRSVTGRVSPLSRAEPPLQDQRESAEGYRKAEPEPGRKTGLLSLRRERDEAFRRWARGVLAGRRRRGTLAKALRCVGLRGRALQAGWSGRRRPKGTAGPKLRRGGCARPRRCGRGRCRRRTAGLRQREIGEHGRGEEEEESRAARERGGSA